MLGGVILHIGAIKLDLQPIFFTRKNVTCVVTLLNTRWQKFEDNLIIMAEVGLHNGHIVIEIGLNFTLELKRRFVAETILVLIQLCRVNTRPGESTNSSSYDDIQCPILSLLTKLLLHPNSLS